MVVPIGLEEPVRGLDVDAEPPTATPLMIETGTDDDEGTALTRELPLFEVEDTQKLSSHVIRSVTTEARFAGAVVASVTIYPSCRCRVWISLRGSIWVF